MEASTARSTKKTKFLSNFLNYAALLIIWAAAFYGIYWLREKNTIFLTSAGNGLIILGAIGLCRWSWLLLHAIRSWFYRLWVFPSWRRKAMRIPVENLPQIAIVIPTYKEKPWITERVFRAIAREAQTIHHPLILVSVTTEAENQAIANIVREEDPTGKSVQHVPLPDPARGKRGALAVGLEALSQMNLPADALVALMDGDSELEPGSLRRCLPFFRLFPRLGGLTTNEQPEVYGSEFFSEWLHLRFCQRHQYMCSHALSHKVLCLTGRCSFFRAEAALEPSFRGLLANDYLNDWLWGQFRFFSGDDKSTWYWLLKRGYDMIYVPDTMVTTIETISGSILERSYQNMRRWSGNMLRNGSRALALGPWRTGLFTWLCVLDQRITIWTSLISPGILLVASLSGDWLKVAILSCWLLITRPLYLFMVFWGRNSRLQLVHLPILLFSQWGTALVKIWTQMNLAQQKWTNRHGSKGKSAASFGLGKWLQMLSSQLLFYVQIFSFTVFLLWQYGTVNLVQDVSDSWQTRQTFAESVPPVEVIRASDYGVYPSDEQDDAVALQTLIARLPPTGNIQIELPLGEIDLNQPLRLERSNTAILGQGMQGTILRVNPAFPKNATVLTIGSSASNPEKKLDNINLKGFQIKPATDLIPTINYISFRNVQEAKVTNLYLEQGNLTMDGATDNIKLEYVVIQ